MWNDIKKLLKESSLYGLGSMSAVFTYFLMTPILTRHLSVEGYGRLSTLNVAVVLATNIVGLGLSSALFNGMLHAGQDADKEKIQGTTWGLLFASSAVFCVCCFVFYKIFEARLSAYADSYLFLLFLLTVAASTIMPVFYSVLRALNKTKHYLALSLISGAFSLLFTIFFVAGLKRSLNGVFEARILFTLLTMFSGFYFVRGIFLRRFDRVEARRLLKFGIYLVPAGILSWVLELSDRFLIQYYLTSKDVGIYTLGYQYATFLTYPMVAFQMAWPQILTEYTKTEDGKTRSGNILTVYLAAVYCLVAALIIFAPEGIHILGGEAFHDSLKVVFPVALSYIFFGLYLWGTSGTYILKSTRMMPYITLAGGVINVAGNVLFIPKYSYMASAYSTLATFAATAALMWSTVYKIYPLRLAWKRNLTHLFLFAIFLALACRFQNDTPALKSGITLLMLLCFAATAFPFRKMNPR